jgi:hypothetical protein
MTDTENNTKDTDSMEVKVNTNEKRVSKRKGAAGVVFVGCLLIGLAAGLLTGQTAVGILGGLGVGFVALGIVRAVTGEW